MTLRYVVSLPDAVERRKKIAESFASMNLDFKMSDAKRMSEDEMKTLSQQGKPKIGMGAIGCFYSHIEIWKRIADGEDRGGFIFEDDALFSKRAHKFCLNDNWIPEDVDVCQLSYTKFEKYPNGRVFRVLKTKKLSEEFELIRVYSPCPWGTIAYWISKKAARRALEMVDYRFEYPVDFFLFSKDSAFWKKNLIYSLTPAVVTELPETHSVRMELDEKTSNQFVDLRASEPVKRSKKIYDKVVFIFCKKKRHNFEDWVKL